MEETETDRRIREYSGEETDKELCMKIGGMEFGLVRISPEDSENMERFRPYCEGSPERKYGLVGKRGAWKISTYSTHGSMPWISS